MPTKLSVKVAGVCVFALLAGATLHGQDKPAGPPPFKVDRNHSTIGFEVRLWAGCPR